MTTRWAPPGRLCHRALLWDARGRHKFDGICPGPENTSYGWITAASYFSALRGWYSFYWKLSFKIGLQKLEDLGYFCHFVRDINSNSRIHQHLDKLINSRSHQRENVSSMGESLRGVTSTNGSLMRGGSSIVRDSIQTQSSPLRCNWQKKSYFYKINIIYCQNADSYQIVMANTNTNTNWKNLIQIQIQRQRQRQ